MLRGRERLVVVGGRRRRSREESESLGTLENVQGSYSVCIANLKLGQRREEMRSCHGHVQKL